MGGNDGGVVETISLIFLMSFCYCCQLCGANDPVAGTVMSEGADHREGERFQFPLFGIPSRGPPAFHFCPSTANNIDKTHWHLYR